MTACERDSFAKVSNERTFINHFLISRLGTYTYRTYRTPSEQLFPNRQLLSYPDLTKTMKTHIRFKQHKIRLQNIKQIEPQQKYRLGTISNIRFRGGGLKPA